MDFKRNEKIVKKRVEKLESYGFKCVTEDREVNCFGTGIDFSAVDEEKFLEHAFDCIKKEYFSKGRKSIQKELKELLDIYGWYILA